MQVGWGQPGIDSVALFACRQRSLTACGHRRLWEKEEMICQPEPGHRGRNSREWGGGDGAQAHK